MSAFLVSDSHIDALVTAAVFGPAESAGDCHGWSAPTWGINNLPSSPSNGSLLGLWLIRENEVSLQARYPGRWGSPVDGYTYAKDLNLSLLPALSILKLLACFEYQSCESDDWESSEVFKFCNNLRSKLVSFLPGYDALPWALD